MVPPAAPSGVKRGDSDVARSALRFVGVRLSELFLLRLVGVLNMSLEREARGLELKMAGEEEATSGRSITESSVASLFFLGVTGLLLVFLSPGAWLLSGALGFV